MRCKVRLFVKILKECCTLAITVEEFLVKENLPHIFDAVANMDSSNTKLQAGPIFKSIIKYLQDEFDIAGKKQAVDDLTVFLRVLNNRWADNVTSKALRDKQRSLERKNLETPNYE